MMPRKQDKLKTFPRRLRMAMAAAEMNSADLMRRATLGSSKISGYLNGHNEPTAYSLFRLCRGLGVSADFLLGLSDDMKIHKRSNAEWE